MRLLVQRVTEASVLIGGKEHSRISGGLLAFIGVTHGDTIEDCDWLCRKLAGMRIFPDGEGKMNLDLVRSGGELLVVSQFTLFASTKKGNRPSFTGSADPALARDLYEAFLERISVLLRRPCLSGIFGADMQVALVNDGPVTILLDSRNKE